MNAFQSITFYTFRCLPLDQLLSRFSEEEICPRKIQQRINVNIKVEILFFNPHDDDSGQFASSHHEG